MAHNDQVGTTSDLRIILSRSITTSHINS